MWSWIYHKMRMKKSNFLLFPLHVKMRESKIGLRGTFTWINSVGPQVRGRTCLFTASWYQTVQRKSSLYTTATRKYIAKCLMKKINLLNSHNFFLISHSVNPTWIRLPFSLSFKSCCHHRWECIYPQAAAVCLVGERASWWVLQKLCRLVPSLGSGRQNFSNPRTPSDSMSPIVASGDTTVVFVKGRLQP